MRDARSHLAKRGQLARSMQLLIRFGKFGLEATDLLVQYIMRRLQPLGCLRE